MNATDPDLSAFHKRGGKLILYHGWNDPGLSAYETVDYYQAVRARMGPATDAFSRLYLIPGLQHCIGGPGATYAGGFNVPFRDPEHDLSAALERWVEQGVAPGELVATAAPDRANLAAPAPPTPRVGTSSSVGRSPPASRGSGAATAGSTGSSRSRARGGRCVPVAEAAAWPSGLRTWSITCFLTCPCGSGS